MRPWPLRNRRRGGAQRPRLGGVGGASPPDRDLQRRRSRVCLNRALRFGRCAPGAKWAPTVAAPRRVTLAWQRHETRKAVVAPSATISDSGWPVRRISAGPSAVRPSRASDCTPAHSAQGFRLRCGIVCERPRPPASASTVGRLSCRLTLSIPSDESPTGEARRCSIGPSPVVGKGNRRQPGGSVLLDSTLRGPALRGSARTRAFPDHSVTEA